jgi:hypothetical protein
MREARTEDAGRKRLRGPGDGAATVTDRARRGPFGKTFLYEQIGLGNLKARKAGRSTVILDDDWDEFLKSLPLVGEAA